MITAIEKQTLRTKLEQYEGKISHMYLDSKGFVTVGIGHLIRNLAAAQQLKFKNTKNMPASTAEIKTDFEAVKKQPANRLAIYYKRFTQLTLSDTEIDKLTDKHIDAFGKELKIIYPGFDQFPSPVKLALFDLVFNVGMTDLRIKWPNFNAAIKANDWQKAANNSNRKAPISRERNKYVKDLLEKAAKTTNSATP